ncbi:MAG: hypothetical protein RL173_2593 [Fibrobacterota bacterium]
MDYPENRIRPFFVGPEFAIIANMSDRAENREIPSVFGYLDYRFYLRDWYQAYKRLHPRFSYRALALKVGYRSHGFFTQVLSNKSNISVETAMNFADTIGLRKRDRDYFLLLVRHNQETRTVPRNKLFLRLSQYAESAAKLLRQDQDAFLDSWKNAAVRELLGLEPFQPGAESAWAARLRPQATAAEVRASMDLLLSLGLACRTASGIVRTDPCVVTGTSYSEEATRRYMRQVHDLGGSALDRFARADRHHAWATVSVSKATFEAMREELRALVARFLSMAEQDDSPERVMQLNLEFFPMAFREIPS